MAIGFSDWQPIGRAKTIWLISGKTRMAIFHPYASRALSLVSRPRPSPFPISLVARAGVVDAYSLGRGLRFHHARPPIADRLALIQHDPDFRRAGAGYSDEEGDNSAWVRVGVVETLRATRSRLWLD